MVADVIEIAGWKPRHHAFPVVVFNAWADFWLTVNRAWFDAVFHPYH